MHLHPESLSFIMYLDSLVAEGREREARVAADLPPTLSRLYLQAMREHDRRSLFLHRRDSAWQSFPDWRFDRQVIRLALYLQERTGIAPGDRVAIVSELRPEWLVADLAGIGLGAVSVGIDPGLPAEALAAALAGAAPRAIFASTVGLERLGLGTGQRPPGAELIVFDGPSTPEGAMSLPTVLDLGGTLDTPERAQVFRGQARELAPERPAIRHYHRSALGGIDEVELTQGEIMRRLNRDWLHQLMRPGDVAYVAGAEVALATRLALYAFLGDGCTTTVLAAPGREPSDLATHHPHTIVAPAAVLAEAVARGVADAADTSNGAGWLRRAARLTRGGKARALQQGIRDALGGQVRRIGPTDSLDPGLAARLAFVAVVGPAPIRTLNQGGEA